MLLLVHIAAWASACHLPCTVFISSSFIVTDSEEWGWYIASLWGMRIMHYQSMRNDDQIIVHDQSMRKEEHTLANRWGIRMVHVASPWGLKLVHCQSLKNDDVESPVTEDDGKSPVTIDIVIFLPIHAVFLNRILVKRFPGFFGTNKFHLCMSFGHNSFKRINLYLLTHHL